jgi:hypothetical protein
MSRWVLDRLLNHRRSPGSKRQKCGALTGADHVCRADKAGVVGTSDVSQLHRIVRSQMVSPRKLSSQCLRRPLPSRDAFQVVGVTTW